MRLNSVISESGIEAHVIAASTTTWGQELWTLETKAPLFIDAEFEKHRMLSSNSSSNRAIPFAKAVKNADFYPSDIRAAEKGMQGYESVDEAIKKEFTNYLRLLQASTGGTLNRFAETIHKQHINRYLGPWMWQKKVVTATEWDNFFSLRLAPDAQPEIQELARCMKRAMDEVRELGNISVLQPGEWHLPYVEEELSELSEHVVRRCSVARCARVSYLNHDNKRPDIERDVALANMLEDSKHMTPFEHQASPMTSQFATRTLEVGVTHTARNKELWSANLRGWIQYRQCL